MITIDREDAEPGITIIDNSTTPGVTYFGLALAGSSRAAPIWQIRKQFTNSDGNIEFAWADANAKFDNVWANRASLLYVGSVV